MPFGRGADRGLRNPPVRCPADNRDAASYVVHAAVHLQEIRSMPLYLDTHKGIPGLTRDAVANAHAADLAVQEKHGVRYMRYWYDEATGKVFCLAEAPNAEAAIAVHREAHGLVADEIVEVKEGA